MPQSSAETVATSAQPVDTLVPVVETAPALVSNTQGHERSRLELNGISKKYPYCVANDHINLHIKPGCIHALLGENGAGKSTLMKIIGGVTKADAGRIIWEGKDTVISSPAQARRLGIAMVFQEFALFESLSVLENIALGMEKQQCRDKRALAARITAVAHRYGMAVEPERPVHTLSAGERQRVEIVRCLMNDTRLLILDEPTAMLAPREVDNLFNMLKQLAAEGTSILFVSHKLEEVRALCAIATVLRHGTVIGSCIPGEVSLERMTAMMVVGQDTPPPVKRDRISVATAALRVKNLSFAGEERFGTAIKNISFDVKAGEILGIAGVAGNGQSELMAVLSGELTGNTGAAIRLGGVALGKLSLTQRRQAGMAFIPAGRLGQSAIAAMNLAENALLTGWRHGLVKRGMLRSTAISRFANDIIDTFRVGGDSEAAAQSLSGGNLQKFVVGRELLQQPRCLVAAHPTRGVDIKAAISIQHALLDLRNRGAAVIVISENTDELFAISDRICALYQGRLSPVQATADTGIAQLGQWMSGLFAAAPVAAA